MPPTLALNLNSDGQSVTTKNLTAHVITVSQGLVELGNYSVQGPMI